MRTKPETDPPQVDGSLRPDTYERRSGHVHRRKIANRIYSVGRW